jgi:hypothetical protein
MINKILEVYLCKGNPYWPLDLKEDYSIFKVSVTMAHFLICNQKENFPENQEYRKKMLDAMVTAIPALLSVMDKEAEECLGDKLQCQIFEHICGPDNAWNLRNAMKFLEFSLQNASDEVMKIVSHVAVMLLMDDNLEYFFTRTKPFCPKRTQYCDFTRKRRDVSEENDFEQYLKTNNVHLRRKRIIDPSEIMRLFNKVICDKKTMESLADYWDEHFSRFSYSRVWLMRIVSDVWCCFVRKLEKIF